MDLRTAWITVGTIMGFTLFCVINEGGYMSCQAGALGRIQQALPVSVPPEATSSAPPTPPAPPAELEHQDLLINSSEIDQLAIQVVRHQQLYGADDSYNDDYTWRRVNASLFKAVGGELLLMSRKQTLPPRAADASAETSQQIDFFNTRQVRQDSPLLIDHVRRHWIRRPSSSPYNLHSPNRRDHSMGQSLVADYILGRKTHGFYVECGALDGETRSNSLFFERFRHWSGVLIEPDPTNYQQLVSRNRDANLVPACLSTTKYAAQVKFRPFRNMGRIVDDDETTLAGLSATTQCLPLYTILLALNVSTVDYFSLDVEGSELQVLKTIPFDKVDIRVLTVEFSHTIEGADALEDFMEEQGYVTSMQITHPRGFAADIVFIKKY